MHRSSLPKVKMSHTPEILVVDDEADSRDTLIDFFKKDRYIIKTSSDGIGALKIAYQKEPDLVLLDIWLKGSDLDGLSILERLKIRYRYLPVIIMASSLHLEIAVKSLRLGAYDYIEKPFTKSKIQILASRAMELYKLKKENDEIKALFENYKIIGESPIIKDLRNKINKASLTSSRVLIEGATGSGKEIIARMIHQKSHEYNSPFLPLYLSQLSESNYLSYIFGKETETNIFANNFPEKGIIEQSNGGTLFIDEIYQMDYKIQSRFLRLLQENIIYREKGSNPIKINTRIIASTSKNLASEVNTNKFREDLYSRLNILRIRVPSISEYRSDIPNLYQYFMTSITKKMGRPPYKISDDALAIMQSYNWPGNLRQFRNVIEWILMMKEPQKILITTNDLPIHITSNLPIDNKLNHKLISSSLRIARQEFEIQYLKTQLLRFSGNISKTSEFVGMERSALHRKLKILGLCR